MNKRQAKKEEFKFYYGCGYRGKQKDFSWKRYRETMKGWKAYCKSRRWRGNGPQFWEPDGEV